MLVHFYTLPHLMVTIETDDQTGLVATKAVSVSKSELENKRYKRFNLFDRNGKKYTAVGFSQPDNPKYYSYEYELSFCQ